MVIGDAQIRKWKDEAEELFVQEEKREKEDYTAPTFPLIGNRASIQRGSDGSIEFVRYLDPAKDLYLQDHQLKSRLIYQLILSHNNPDY